MYAFIFSQEQFFPVILLCSVLSVSRSCYYVYRKDGNDPPGAEKKQIEAMVIAAFALHKRRYGIRRLLPELADLGLKIGHCKVRRILKQNGLIAIQPKSFVPRTTDSRHPYPISPNLLTGRKHPVRINEVWVGDITYIPLAGGGWGYLAVWMDLFSRKVTGWQLLGNMREELIVQAFKKACTNRNITEDLIIHSDRGGQYAGNKFRRLLAGPRLSQSMSGVANPYDNAFMESYFSRFKAELLQGGCFDGLENARKEIFEFIEMYYNPVRRHSSLGYISPVAFERQAGYQQKQESG
ncbi:IS3 family transposase [Mucilaginibacter dorajii]|uniref:IS3 family transposase n=1 Tax=Mucilaginibacter dorajii TaxID=692994 RepID=UPI00216A9386|nr:IS3 family transposase [Mucilaginibacter dorajii]MCS3734043.1 transposase InsO family protein [Mucilaginibacter dorajii]